MSIKSVEDFDPTASAPVFGSAVSQTKLQQQQQPINDIGGVEKIATPPHSAVNGQNDSPTNKISDNLENRTTETVNGKSSSDSHVNGEKINSTNETNPITKDGISSTEKPISTSQVTEKIENDPLVAPTSQLPTSNEPKSTSTNLVKENDSIVPKTNVENPLETSVKTTNDETSTTIVPPVETESIKTDRKSKSPRGKAKSPVVATPPTRHSTRSRKPVTPLEEKEQTEKIEEISVTKNQNDSPSPSKRTKRQTKDVKPEIDQPTSCNDLIEEKTPDVVPPVVEQETRTVEVKTPPTRRGGRTSKREASSSPTTPVSKKTKISTPKGNKISDEQAMDVEETKDAATTPISNTPETSPKKGRTSGNRKTPTPTTTPPPTTTTTTPESAGEYIRKLRPRK